MMSTALICLIVFLIVALLSAGLWYMLCRLSADCDDRQGTR